MIGIAAQLQVGLGRAAREMAAGLDASIQKNFTSNGRPAWRPTQRGGAILQKTGRLATAITVTVDTEGETTFAIVARTNNIPYARIHQFGGIITPKSKQYLAIPTSYAKGKRPRDFEGLFFVAAKRGNNPTLCKKVGKTVKAFFILMKEVRIPARPYLGLQQEDSDLFKEIIAANGPGNAVG
jgi:phage gpG-like protein